ncbi:hypothetical protein BpHYR1_036935 [Brachionus plicatilis]|uniref:Tc1-like transposase DDE domain-containing protein n=1 Tax=Brachionus plicatilis TaxID=10195 RepID=A0A3M7PII7_BRAPC|nr:hypothetical protein BpHYR1_036935 [Brachionus plicatilis]
MKVFQDNLKFDLYRKEKSLPKSPDLKPIERVWNKLKVFLRSKQIKSEEEINDKLEEFKRQLSPEKYGDRSDF